MKLIQQILILVLFSILATQLFADDLKISNDKRVDEDTIIRYVNKDTYQVWEKVDEFNVREVQQDKVYNEDELAALEAEKKDCLALPDKYAKKCLVEIQDKIDMIEGEQALFDAKIDYTK